MEEQLTVATHTAGPCVIVALDGDLDVTNAPVAEEAVRAAWEDPHSHMVFDLTRLAFMDSTGVRVLVRARRQAGEHGATIALAGLTPSVSRIVHLTGLNRAFAVHATLGEALAAHSAGGVTIIEAAD
jgi:anti-sigma B factor antagonist